MRSRLNLLSIVLENSHAPGPATFKFLVANLTVNERTLQGCKQYDGR